jgi:hypothetical protein
MNGAHSCDGAPGWDGVPGYEMLRPLGQRNRPYAGGSELVSGGRSVYVTFTESFLIAGAERGESSSWGGWVWIFQGEDLVAGGLFLLVPPTERVGGFPLSCDAVVAVKELA